VGNKFSITKMFYPIKLEMLVEFGTKISSFRKKWMSKMQIAVSFGKKFLLIWFIYVLMKKEDVLFFLEL